MTRPGIEPRSPGSFANTLPAGPIGLKSRVFTNGPGDWVSIPGRVIPKTQKVVLDAALLGTLSIIRWGSRVKWSNPGNGVAHSPTPSCSSY